MKLRFYIILASLICLTLPMHTLAQVPPTTDELKNFLKSLNQPIKQINLRFVTNTRDETWINPNVSTTPLPSDSEIAMLTSAAAAIAADPGQFTVVAKDNQEYPYDNTLGVQNSPTINSAIQTIPSQQSCQQAADAWHTELDDSKSISRSELSKRHVIVFDHRGVICARIAATNRITEGDILYFGLFGTLEQVGELRRKITTCSIESNAPNILGSSTGLTFQSSDTSTQILRRWPPSECFDSKIEIQFIKPDNVVAFSEIFNQYERFRATYQIGTLWTKLDERGYTVTDFGEGAVVRESVDGSRGPLYTASLVLYAFPRYFSSLTGNGIYSGRDIVNDNNIVDRIGLVMTFGLDKPEDTLGVGLSFEVAAGFNLTFTKLYRRVSRLDGISLGDSFGGTQEEIPTKETWKNEFTIGLSIDGRYLTKYFGGGSD